MVGWNMIRRLGRRVRGLAEPMATVPTLDREQRFIVTGASSGIGEQTAWGLARAGASVLVVGRNPERTARVAAAINEACGPDRAHAELADFGSLDAVRALAHRLLAREAPIHGLVHNAGLWHPKRHLSHDGIEDTWAVNQLAPFLLTALLRDALVRSAPARVVLVSSRLHRTVPALRFDDLEFEHAYNGIGAYAHSKLANVLFASELARRLHGTGVTSNSLHPGDVATDVTRDAPWLRAAQGWVAPALMSPTEGAQCTLHVTTHPSLEQVSGAYFADLERIDPSIAAQDRDAAARLWSVCAQRVGLR